MVRSTAVGALAYTAAIYMGTSIHNWFANRRNETIDLQNDMVDVKHFIKKYEEEKLSKDHASRIQERQFPSALGESIT